MTSSIFKTHPLFYLVSCKYYILLLSWPFFVQHRRDQTIYHLILLTIFKFNLKLLLCHHILYIPTTYILILIFILSLVLSYTYNKFDVTTNPSLYLSDLLPYSTWYVCQQVIPFFSLGWWDISDIISNYQPTGCGFETFLCVSFSAKNSKETFPHN